MFPFKFIIFIKNKIGQVLKIKETLENIFI